MHATIRPACPHALRWLAACVLAFAASGCADDSGADDQGGHAGDTGAADFSLGLTEMSGDGLFQVRLVEATPAPPQKYENDWVVELLDPDGALLTDADLVKVQPWMPAHGHDGNFSPEWEADPENPGRYVVNRINLWMSGLWEVRFDVKVGDEQDRAIIEVTIPK